jgi:nucleoside-diphosphate-sugar epimerase
LHQDGPAFRQHLERIEIVLGDLSLQNLGLTNERRTDVLGKINSILHIGASLNRRSEKTCLNVNLRGTLSVLKLAMELAKQGRLRRFSHVSTVAVAGRRQGETVTESEAIDWSRSDYDPYARTKKFCEHMARELLPADKVQFLRPSIVMGDSRFPQTTQFDMVRAFCALADLSAMPMRAETRLDIVNADFVGKAIARLHTMERPRHDIYHLSSGEQSVTAQDIADVMAKAKSKKPLWFMPGLDDAFYRSVQMGLWLPRETKAHKLAALLNVFWPYITYDTVFDNARVTEELGIAPTRFTDYCAALYHYAKEQRFRYPYRPMPLPHVEAA